MTSLEFTKNIVLQLSEDDRTQVVRKAVQKGFTVNGFSKKPHSAPALAIVNCLGLKKQGKYFYEIILEVIKQLSYEKRDNELYRLVERWTENVEEHEKIALDYQIVQRVLTKVRGPESQLGYILKRESDNNFYKIFEEYSELSEFENCIKVIEQKQKELEAYGYCI